ncbi:hypothetical protein ACVILE_002986 [Streptomyces sp. M18.1]
MVAPVPPTRASKHSGRPSSAADRRHHRGPSSHGGEDGPRDVCRGCQSRSGVRMPSRAMPRCRVRAVTSHRNSRLATCSGVSAFSTGHLS